MQAVMSPVQLVERAMLVAEQALLSEGAVLGARRQTEVEEVSTVLILELVAVNFNCSLSELLLAVCKFAAGLPALGSCNPSRAESVAFSLLKVLYIHEVLKLRVVHFMPTLSQNAHACGYFTVLMRL